MREKINFEKQSDRALEKNYNYKNQDISKKNITISLLVKKLIYYLKKHFR